MINEIIAITILMVNLGNMVAEQTKSDDMWTFDKYEEVIMTDGNISFSIKGFPGFNNKHVIMKDMPVEIIRQAAITCLQYTNRWFCNPGVGPGENINNVNCFPECAKWGVSLNTNYNCNELTLTTKTSGSAATSLVYAINKYPKSASNCAILAKLPLATNLGDDK